MGENAFVRSTIVKVDTEKHLVFGWAYIAYDRNGEIVVDHSGDFVEDVEEIELAAHVFVLSSRRCDTDHERTQAGTLIESVVFTPAKIEGMGLPQDCVPLGWWVGFHVHDRAVWSRIKSGELRAFSIAGTWTSEPVSPDDHPRTR